MFVHYMAFFVFIFLVVFLCGMLEARGLRKELILLSLLLSSLVVLGISFLWPGSTSGMFFFYYQYFYTDSLVVFTFKFLVFLFFVYILVVSRILVALAYSYEYVIFVWFAFLGLCLSLSAYDFLSLYLGMELSALSFYVLVSYSNNSLSSAEAGLKYFILGSLSSAFFLYGVGIIYGFSGTLNFGKLYLLFQLEMTQTKFYTQFLLGSGFILVSFLFKLGVFPFHMWVPDVYAGGSVVTVAFLSTLPKLVYLVVFFKLFFFVFISYLDFFCLYFLFVAMFSMVVGCLGSLGAMEFRSLLGYSSVANFGLVFFALSTFTYSSIVSVFFFVCIYLVMLFLLFCVLMNNVSSGIKLESIYDLVDCGGNGKKMSFILVFCLLSFGGMPPFAGFFGKLMLLQSAVAVPYVWINFFVFFIMFLMTPIMIFIYLRLMGVIWFGEHCSVPFFYDFSNYFVVLMGSVLNCLFMVVVQFFYSKLTFILLGSSVFCV